MEAIRAGAVVISETLPEYSFLSGVANLPCEKLELKG